jgi:hypothetical protein
MTASGTGTVLRPTSSNPALLFPAILALSGSLLISISAWIALRNSSDMTEAAASELNHHLAGYLLIFMSVMIMASLLFDRFRPLKFAWPLVFIALAIFLAAWSDAEIWPRGPLSWSWLIHHDAEARQHKIYAAILLSIGVVEFLRAHGKLRPRLQLWALPVLATVGVWLLTMHAHGGTSGLPAGWSPSQPLLAAEPKPPSEAMPTSGAHHHHEQHTPASSSPPAHEHTMTGAMLKIQHEHFWMALVGIVFALSKFLADTRSSFSRFMQYCWPSAMACLGVLLVMYRE